jgi:precorrin-2/cobalt-factor-2 C20-methyltransferase
MLGAAAALGAPLVYRNQSLLVLSGVLSEEELTERLSGAEAAVVMKLGRNFDKVRRVLERLGMAERALYIERATMAEQRSLPLAEVDPMASPYFSLILVPGPRWQG